MGFHDSIKRLSGPPKRWKNPKAVKLGTSLVDILVNESKKVKNKREKQLETEKKL